ncbi:hypothetical protein [Pseudomonas botevensis]|uniref:hypothetical protein n=1 Tax=Pseudomonas botevensis TaxID=2842352 RepID=UPI001C3CAADA|nr:hypothetical protein [Pseudomonas botevensis]MBV4476980.1 hypothetical protein [Pseudomonas botevensis]
MNPPLTINPKDGSIHIAFAECNFLIEKTFTSDTIAAPLAQLFRSERDHKNGYMWRTYHGVSIEGVFGGFDLCFHFGRLTAIHIGAVVPSLETENGWPTRKSIELEVNFLKSSLRRQLSRSFLTDLERFSWGSAWATFDEKGFSASAGISYAPTSHT